MESTPSVADDAAVASDSETDTPPTANPLVKGSSWSIRSRTWTVEEDQRLKEGVQKCHPPKLWTQVAAYVPGRSASQCRARWKYQIRPNLNTRKFSQEEDEFIINARARGMRWVDIAQAMDRTDNQVKNRWNTQHRRVGASKPLPRDVSTTTTTTTATTTTTTTAPTAPTGVPSPQGVPLDVFARLPLADLPASTTSLPTPPPAVAGMPPFPGRPGLAASLQSPSSPSPGVVQASPLRTALPPPTASPAAPAATTAAPPTAVPPRATATTTTTTTALPAAPPPASPTVTTPHSDASDATASSTTTTTAEPASRLLRPAKGPPSSGPASLPQSWRGITIPQLHGLPRDAGREAAGSEKGGAPYFPVVPAGVHPMDPPPPIPGYPVPPLLPPFPMSQSLPLWPGFPHPFVPPPPTTPFDGGGFNFENFVNPFLYPSLLSMSAPAALPSLRRASDHRPSSSDHRQSSTREARETRDADDKTLRPLPRYAEGFRAGMKRQAERSDDGGGAPSLDSLPVFHRDTYMRLAPAAAPAAEPPAKRVKREEQEAHIKREGAP